MVCGRDIQEVASWCAAATYPAVVGASSLAMVVNDDAGSLTPRGVLWFFASELAPTGNCVRVFGRDIQEVASWCAAATYRKLRHGVRPRHTRLL